MALWQSVILFFMPVCGFAVEIIAHRGASFDAPENTLAAMKLAWEQGADAIELDLHFSADERIVVIHDPDLKRVAGKTGKVSEQRWADLSSLDVGAWKDAKFKGERIPALPEILATVPAGRRAFIELKCGPEILPELQRVLSASRLPPERFVLIGFGLETMRQAKAAFPSIPVLFLHGWKKDAPVDTAEVVAQARAAGLDGVNLHHDFPVSEAFVRRIREAGLSVYVWTVDAPDVARRWMAAGVDGITTNRPRFLREQL